MTTPPTPEQVAELIHQLDDACPIVSDENGRTDYGLTDRIRRATVYLAALHADNARLREALTPSGDTKAAYMGEFSWEEESDDGRGVATRTIPWTTIKEIMAAIRQRADAAHPTTQGDAREGASRD